MKVHILSKTQLTPELQKTIENAIPDFVVLDFILPGKPYAFGIQLDGEQFPYNFLLICTKPGHAIIENQKLVEQVVQSIDCIPNLKVARIQAESLRRLEAITAVDQNTYDINPGLALSLAHNPENCKQMMKQKMKRVLVEYVADGNVLSPNGNIIFHVQSPGNINYDPSDIYHRISAAIYMCPLIRSRIQGQMIGKIRVQIINDSELKLIVAPDKYHVRIDPKTFESSVISDSSNAASNIMKSKLLSDIEFNFSMTNMFDLKFQANLASQLETILPNLCNNLMRESRLEFSGVKIVFERDFNMNIKKTKLIFEGVPIDDKDNISNELKNKFKFLLCTLYGYLKDFTGEPDIVFKNEREFQNTIKLCCIDQGPKQTHSDVDYFGNINAIVYTFPTRDVTPTVQSDKKIDKVTPAVQSDKQLDKVVNKLSSCNIGSPITKTGQDYEEMKNRIIRIISLIGDDKVKFSSFLRAINEKLLVKALHIACAYTNPKYTELLAILLQYKDKLNFNIDEQIGSKNKAAIHCAAANKNLELYDMLVRHGSNPNLTSGEGKTAVSIREECVRGRGMSV